MGGQGDKRSKRLRGRPSLAAVYPLATKMKYIIDEIERHEDERQPVKTLADMTEDEIKAL